MKRPHDPEGKEHHGHHSREFFNELLSCALARRLGIPVPGCAIVEIHEDTVEGFARGRYFGSRLMPGHSPLPPGSSFVCRMDSYDPTAVYSLLAFDVLLLNSDRK